jgi:hypothetical protein
MPALYDDDGRYVGRIENLVHVSCIGTTARWH